MTLARRRCLTNDRTGETNRSDPAGASGLQQLFPTEVVAMRAIASDASAPLYPEEEACVQHAVLKRRREFREGRACARRALERLGVGRHAIVAGPDRAPLWPDGVVGSITHCAGFAAAAVARSRVVSGLGLDAEPASPLDQRIIPLICTPFEHQRLVSQSPSESGHWAKALFCAKEAIFKCLFPNWRVWFDFHDVHVAFDPSAGRFSVEPVGERVGVFRDLTKVEGTFVRTHTHWLAGAFVRL